MEALNESITLEGKNKSLLRLVWFIVSQMVKEHACYLNIFCDYLYKNSKRYTTFYLLDNDSLIVQYIIVNCPRFLLYF